MKRSLLFLIAFLFTAANSRAGFLDSGWGARPAGLGDAFSAVADDANAPLFNPAGITQVDHHELTFMYGQLFTGLDLKAGNESTSLGLHYLSYVSPPMGSYGSLGVSWANFQTEGLYREDTYSLTYAKSFSKLSLGVNLKSLRSSFSLDDLTVSDPMFQNHSRSKTAFTVDTGLLLKPELSFAPGLKLAVVGKNLTRPDMAISGTDKLPVEMRFGAAYDDPNTFFVSPSIDVVSRDGDVNIQTGVERYFFDNKLGLRMGGHKRQVGCGVSFYHKLNETLTAGFDYGFAWPLQVEGTTGSHRTSLTIYF